MDSSSDKFLFKPISIENRKRNRMSPRTLFGNLKIQKSFNSEDNSFSREPNKFKTGVSWKPPLKAELNSSHSSYQDFQDQGTFSLTSNSQNLNDNEENNIDPNGSYLIGDQESSSESFTGNLEDTIPYNYSEEQNTINEEKLDFQKHSNSQNVSLDNSFNEDCSENSVNNIEYKLKQDSQKNCNEQLKAMLEKQDFNTSISYRVDCQDDRFGSPQCSTSNNNHENINMNPTSSNFETNTELLMENFVEPLEKSPNRYSEEIIKDSNRTNYPIKKCMKKDEGGLYRYMNEYNATDRNESQSIIKEEYFYEEPKKNKEIPKPSKHDIDDSFDIGVTNSQFLHLESEVIKHPYNVHMRPPSTSNIELNNNLENIKRSYSSLAVEAECNKKKLKSILRDVDDLNKSIVNALTVLKSVRENSAT